MPTFCQNKPFSAVMLAWTCQLQKVVGTDFDQSLSVCLHNVCKCLPVFTVDMKSQIFCQLYGCSKFLARKIFRSFGPSRILTENVPLRRRHEPRAVDASRNVSVTAPRPRPLETWRPEMKRTARTAQSSRSKPQLIVYERGWTYQMVA